MDEKKLTEELIPEGSESPELMPEIQEVIPEEAVPIAVQPSSTPAPTPAAAPAPAPAAIRPHSVVQGRFDSAVTVYVPYQPEGPTVTQLEKAAKEAKTALKKQIKSDKKRLRVWKKDAVIKAQNYLTDLKSCDTPEERGILKKRYKLEKKAWHKSIKGLDDSEKKLQKKAFRAFRKRVTRVRRCVSWIVAFAILATAVWMAVPMWENLVPAVTVRYTADGDRLETAMAYGTEVSGKISDEGIVLLENRDGFLPLADLKLNVFGLDAYQINYGEEIRSGLSLFEGLESAGVAYNVALHSVYLQAVSDLTEKSAAAVKRLVTRSDASAGSGTEYLTDELMENARKFSDQALLIIGVDDTAGEDRSVDSLALSAGRRALLRKLDENFEHVIVVLNSAGMLELEELNECKHVDAVLWMGIPGPYGGASLAKILSGELSPSGRLPDTWTYEGQDFPSAVNFTKDLNRYRYSGTDKNYTQYEEGIYVGYRYFETRYIGDDSGYEKTVRYPFGYGLSYTEFSWETVSFRETSDSVIWRVRVTNTGDCAGKDVVELYCSAPYTEGDPEKSEAVLAAYAKTGTLEPGENDIVTLKFRIRDLASYDKEQELYLLSAGTYRLNLSRHVHASVESKEFEIPETLQYDTDDRTETKIESRFGFADGGLTSLSRADWVGTYPRGLTNEPCASSLKADIRSYNDPDPSAGELPETGANNGIKLRDLKGLDYNDEKWTAFLDQFSVEELSGLFSKAGWCTEAVPRLGIPEIRLLGGSSGLNAPFKKLQSTGYPSEVTLASTWNDSLAGEFGSAVGQEAAAYGVHIWYGPELSLHRTPYGGRNEQSWSEDPLLSGKMASAVVKGAQKHGVVAVLRGFVTDSNVTGENAGLYAWMDEQALRELYLRPFEIAIKEGGACGVMSSVMHLGYQWCGACEELLIGLLRGEWGFDGFVISDLVSSAFMDSSLACRRGGDLMRETGLLASERNVKRAYRSDPTGVTEGLRTCAHNFCYTIVNQTDLF